MEDSSFNVLLVDDDRTTLRIIGGALREIAATVVTCNDPQDALEEQLEAFDIVISDFYMPTIRGDVFLQEIKQRVPELPVMFLTANESASLAAELMRKGGDDYVQKPVDPADFSFRVKKLIREKQRERQLNRVEKERAILDFENRKLVNWRLLYANKDVRQTEQLIENMSRNMSQSGGFMWLELLSSSMSEADNDNYLVPKEVLDVAIEAATNQKKVYSEIEFIASIDTVPLSMQTLSAQNLVAWMKETLDSHIGPLTDAYERPLWIGNMRTGAGTLSVDLSRLQEALFELAVNAIKYSPVESPVFIDAAEKKLSGQPFLAVKVSNYARQLQAKDAEGKHVYGIPYEYAELVFDLFFTIEAYQEHFPQEQWSNGTGLYIVRRLMKRMNGWVTASAGIDYSVEVPQPIVCIELRFPLGSAAS